jgi:hypothetical protein
LYKVVVIDEVQFSLNILPKIEGDEKICNITYIKMRTRMSVIRVMMTISKEGRFSAKWFLPTPFNTST